MNCKQGELAIVVAAPNDPHYLGKVVTVTEMRFIRGAVCWDTHPPMFWVDQFGVSHTLPWVDCDLRPIRDHPGPDESLTWRDVPEVCNQIS